MGFQINNDKNEGIVSSQSTPEKKTIKDSKKIPPFFGRAYQWLKNIGTKTPPSKTANTKEQLDEQTSNNKMYQTGNKTKDFVITNPLFEDSRIPEAVIYESTDLKHDYETLLPMKNPEVNYATLKPRETKGQPFKDNKTEYADINERRSPAKAPIENSKDVYAQVNKEKGIILESKQYQSVEPKKGKFTGTPMPSHLPFPPKDAIHEKEEPVYDELAPPVSKRSTRANEDYESIYDRVAHTKDEDLYEIPAPKVPERGEKDRLDRQDFTKMRKRAGSLAPPLPENPPPSSSRKRALSSIEDERGALKNKRAAYLKELDDGIEELKEMAKAAKAKKQFIEESDVPDLELLEGEREALLDDYDDFIDPLNDLNQSKDV